MSVEIYRAIIRSREQARHMYAEQQRIDPSEVEVMIADYRHDAPDATGVVVEWFCWQRGTWVYEDEDGNMVTR